jgi:type IV secretory pathway TraG/TraD family ATPase VirD4
VQSHFGGAGRWAGTGATRTANKHRRLTEPAVKGIGRDDHGLVWAGPQQAMPVLGPPLSGKTSRLVVPNVLATPGPVLVTSTKTDVLEATLPAARRSDAVGSWAPTGTLEPPPGLTRP